MITSETLGKRIIKGSFARFILLLFNIIISFYMVPFVINAIGDRFYGFWIIVGTFIGYYGILDLGLSSAVSRFASQAFGKGDYNEMNSVVNTSLVIFTILGFLVLCISIAVATLCPYFISNKYDVSLFRKIILIMGCSVAISFPIKTFIGVLISTVRYNLISYVEFIKLVIRTTLIIVFINNGFGILSLAVITFCVDGMGNLMYFFIVKKKFNYLNLTFSKFQPKKIKPLLNYSKYSFLAQTAGLLRFKIDSFVIAGFIGLNSVTYYFVATRLIDYFKKIVISLIGVLSPVFSQYEGMGDSKSIRNLFLNATKISVFLSVFIGGSIIIYGKSFIERWMGTSYTVSYQILLILSISMTFALMQNPSIGLMYGISKHKFFAMSNSFEGILNLLLSLILVRYYGVYGVALGTAIPMLLIKLIIQPVYICRIVKIKISTYYIATIGIPFFKILVFIIPFWFFGKDYLRPDYAIIFKMASLQVLIFIPFFYLFLLTSSQRQFLIAGVLRFYKKV